MMRRSAIIGLSVVVLAVFVTPAGAAQRTVLAEMFGASWCGYCPNARAALVQLQEEYGTDDLVVLYYHVNDPYATSETHSRASYYQVGGIPEVDFDATTEVVGAGSPEAAYGVYQPVIDTRLAASTPITMSVTGIVNTSSDPDSSWVTATFRVVDTVPETYGTLRAQFVVYEDIHPFYPWTVRDMLPSANISTLAAPGDSVVLTRKFVINAAWNYEEMHVAVFLEDTSPKLIVNAQLMPEPYGNRLFQTNTYAEEVEYFGEAVYHTTLQNTGVMGDTITVSVTNDILPEGLGPYDWVSFFCDSNGTCYFTPWDYYLEPGEVETFDIHVIDGIGSIRGMALTTLRATSKSDTSLKSSESFATFVDLPSILLVDDDGGTAYESYLQTAVEDTGYAVRVWDTHAKGRPTLEMLSSYWAVLWSTANGSATYIGGTCENNMVSYLDGGGNLMLAGMNFLSSRVDTLPFVKDYLHVESWTDDAGAFVVSGSTYDPISDGMSLNLLGGPFAPNGSDPFVAGSPADVIFTSPVGDEGIRVEENGHKLVFLSFPFEDVKTSEPAPNNQKVLAGRILEWFQAPTGVDSDEPGRLVLNQNAPNPFNPVTNLTFTVPEGAGRVSLSVYDVSGRLVRTLVNEILPAGRAGVVWDGRDDRGLRLSSGVYFVRLEAGGQRAMRKVTLLK
jgi:thiol-disulfide isomerase/thioredoxin